MEEDGHFTNLLIEGSSAVGLDGLRSQLEEEHLPMVDNTRSARPNQKRSKNFSEEEDVLLVSAWLNISMDPVLGTNQTHSAFWKRIYDFFHENKDFTSDRSQSSLFHRWTTIQEHVNKFCGFVSQIERRRQSGATAHDKFAQAMALFKAGDGNKRFQFTYCWNVLRTQPKWHDKQKQLSSQKPCPNKKQKTTTEASRSMANPINGDANHDARDNGPAETEEPKRPMGKKRAKEQLRQGGGDSCVDALDHFWGKKRSLMQRRRRRKKSGTSSLMN